MPCRFIRLCEGNSICLIAGPGNSSAVLNANDQFHHVIRRDIENQVMAYVAAGSSTKHALPYMAMTAIGSALNRDTVRSAYRRVGIDPDELEITGNYDRDFIRY